MPALQIPVPHPFDQEIATEKLQRFAEKAKLLYGDQVKDLQETWEGPTVRFSFSAKGFKIDGQLVVDDAKVTLDGTLPFAAMMFRKRIENDIRAALSKALQ